VLLPSGRLVHDVDALAREGVTIRTGVTVQSVRQTGGGIEVTLKCGDAVDTVIGSHLLLAAGEPVPTPAPLRQALHRGASQLLGLGRRPAGTLMTGLPAPLTRFAPLALQLLLRTLPRQLTTLLTRQRQIRRGRHRTVARGAVHLPLELLDPLLQPGHLLHRPRDPIQHVKQPDHQLARRFPASQRDRFRLRSIHDRKIPSAEKESCSPPRLHLNAYE